MIKVEDLPFYTSMYFAQGKSVPFKLQNGNVEIQICPIKVKDGYQYELSKTVLEFEKNSVNDIKVIQETYLEYLLTTLYPQYNEVGIFLQNLLNLTIGKEYKPIAITNQKEPCLVNGKPVIGICDTNNTLVGYMTQKEFDDYKFIVLNQNDADYDNRYIAPDIKQVVELYYQSSAKKTKNPTIEEKLAYVTSKTGIKLSDLLEYTYRYFNEVCESCLKVDEYIGQKIIQGSFKYDVKQNIIHPLYEPKRDFVAEAFSGSVEDFAQSRGLSVQST